MLPAWAREAAEPPSRHDDIGDDTHTPREERGSGVSRGILSRGGNLSRRSAGGRVHFSPDVGGALHDADDEYEPPSVSLPAVPGAQRQQDPYTSDDDADPAEPRGGGSRRAGVAVDRESLRGIFPASFGERAMSAKPVHNQKRVTTATREALGTRGVGMGGYDSDDDEFDERAPRHALLARVRAMNESSASTKAASAAREAAARSAAAATPSFSAQKAAKARRGVWAMAPPPCAAGAQPEDWNYVPPYQVMMMGMCTMNTHAPRRTQVAIAAGYPAALSPVQTVQRQPPRMMASSLAEPAPLLGPAPWVPGGHHVSRARPAQNGKWMFPEPGGALLSRQTKQASDRAMLANLEALEAQAGAAVRRPRIPHAGKVDPELGMAIPSRGARAKRPHSLIARANAAGAIARDLREVRQETERVLHEQWDSGLGRAR